MSFYAVEGDLMELSIIDCPMANDALSCSSIPLLIARLLVLPAVDAFGSSSDKPRLDRKPASGFCSL